MSRFTGWDIWIEFTVNVEKPQYRYVSWIRKKRWWGSGWWWYTTSWWYREAVWYWIDRSLNQASHDIASLIAYHLREYSPVDKSKYADNVVMKNNIVVVWTKWEYEVWFENIPYATRRNYEQSEVYNKLWNNLHFVERAWNDNIREYEEILDEASENWIDELLSAYLNRSSWATTGYNWWEQTRGLHY